MSNDPNAFMIHHSALSDRGLNERRPLNEDALLADEARHIFAVADGVGGAEAGEVASQTAIEVLDEAFRHRLDGADIEDLMELAIQRANSSIHQMAQEHARFSMMATTLVVLHLNRNIATIGHVGDSRLYRLTPDGQLLRETEDHSIVEEEVRAGRMTPEQAANHPSKNVISRALGADSVVEVDMKTMEVEDGTEFLLCTDGITRHVSDSEIRQLLVLDDDLDSICQQLKNRCFERGAEDNLTVVVVRVGKRITADQRMDELEPTITPETQLVHASRPDGQRTTGGSGQENALVPPSRIAFPAPDSGQPANTNTRIQIEAPRSGGGAVLRVLGFFFVLILLAGAFYAGARFKERIPFLAEHHTIVEPVAPAKTAVVEPFVKFEKARRDVDRDPRGWLAGEVGKELLTSGVSNPLDSTDPGFLYLYGRANLLTGNSDEAAKAFEASLAKADPGPSEATATIKKESAIGLAAVSLKNQKQRARALAHYDELTTPAANMSSP
jgi:serine/threonine protein phosphatase PrpC